MTLSSVSSALTASPIVPLAAPAPASQSASTSTPTPAEGSATVELRLSLSVELGVRVSIGRERAAAIPPNAVEDRYEEIEEEGDGRGVDGELRDRARSVAKRLDRLVRRAMQPLLRGRTGVDAETRAELRELRQGLREDLRLALDEAGNENDFDVAAFAVAISDAVDRFRDGFTSIVEVDSPAPADDGVIEATRYDAPLAPELRADDDENDGRVFGRRRGRPFVDQAARLARANERIDSMLDFVRAQLQGLLDALDLDDEDPATGVVTLRDGTRDLQPVIAGEGTLQLLA